MNNLKTNYNGGFPLVLDDLRWIDASVREAFKGIMSAFNATGSETFILIGCVRTVDTGVVSISAGYVSIGGEVCAVSAHSYAEPTGGDVEYWSLVTSFDTDGDKEFQDTTVNQTYEIRKAKVLVAASVPADHSAYDSLETIHKYIVDKLPRDSWKLFNTLTVGVSGLFPGTWNALCYKDLDGFIHLKGTLLFEDESPGPISVLKATLPVGYRPSETLTRVIGVDDGTGAATICLLSILVNGEIRLKTRAGLPYAGKLEMSQVSPFSS